MEDAQYNPRPASVTQKRLAKSLGAGTLAFGVLCLARPQILARMIACDEETAREIGFRDVGSGALTRD